MSGKHRSGWRSRQAHTAAPRRSSACTGPDEIAGSADRTAAPDPANRDPAGARGQRNRNSWMEAGSCGPETVDQAENEVPQPQPFSAFGLSNTKPDCISDSL